MTEDDKKLIADYMWWQLSEYGGGYYYIPKDGRVINFDLNDAALCVAEMQKRGEWADFRFVAFGMCGLCDAIRFEAWLISMEDGQAKNFFKAFAEWRKGK